MQLGCDGLGCGVDWLAAGTCVGKGGLDGLEVDFHEYMDVGQGADTVVCTAEEWFGFIGSEGGLVVSSDPFHG